MGKGQRNKTNAATFAAAKDDKKGSTKNILIIVSVVLVVAILAGLIIYGQYVNNGGYLRSTIAVSSEHYKVNNAMMSYFYNTTYQNEMAQNGYYYVYYYGLDTQKSMKEQKYSDTATWFDYFMNRSKASVKSLLVYCEAARAANMTLNKEDNAEIDAAIASIKDAAKNYGYGEDYYVRTMFGFGVNFKDIRSCMELSKLASKYYEKLKGEIEGSFSEADKEAYYQENKKDFSYIDYLTYSFTFTPELEEGAEKPEKYTEDEANYASIQTLADELATKKTVEEFKAYVDQYIKDTTYKDYELIAEDATPSTEEGVKQYKQSDVDKLVANVVKEEVAYSESNEIIKWAFDDARVAGDSTTTKSFAESTNKYTVTASVLVKPMYRLVYNTVDVCHILFGVGDYGKYETKEAAREAAEAVLEQFVNGESKTQADFEALAAKYNDDSNCYYNQIRKGQMVQEFNDWIFVENREPGETAIVDTQYGSHVMYMVLIDEQPWAIDVKNALESNKYDEEFDKLEETYKVTVNNAACNVIEG